MLKALALPLALVAAFAWHQQELQSVYDQQKDLTTIRLPSTKLSGPKDRYHSLSFSIDYSYPGKTPSLPERVNFELVSVVKAQRLNPDLYVVFVADGKPIHFSSNRSAIRNPVRGKPWIGEKMVFLIPREDFMKLAAAEKLAIRLGGVTFEFSEESRDVVRTLAEGIKR
ncbi:MAG TPA: hypothetical protein VN844_18150 [Pyrinomonadaceae bacterium]|nr:hypothetical protein [Pyrinomonadaceae bacterium]